MRAPWIWLTRYAVRDCSHSSCRRELQISTQHFCIEAVAREAALCCVTNEVAVACMLQTAESLISGRVTALQARASQTELSKDCCLCSATLDAPG